MADYTQYHALGQGMGNDPNDPNRNNPYAAPGQVPYQQQQQQQQQ
ncbi:hypothetical protein PCL_02792, partial [Purpureocillium lilacinum]